MWLEAYNMTTNTTILPATAVTQQRSHHSKAITSTISPDPLGFS
jgi:hypothetical protein